MRQDLTETLLFFSVAILKPQEYSYPIREGMCMIGLIIGILTGVGTYWLLSKFSTTMTQGTAPMKGSLYGILSFLLPMAALIAVAFIKRSDLLISAIGIIACLLASAVLKYMLGTRKSRGREDNHE